MIYILDNTMKIINIQEPLENIQTTELPDDDSLIKNYVHVSIEIDEEITDNARFIAMKAKNGSEKAFELFEIISEETGEETQFVAIDIGVRETGGYVVKDFRPENKSVRFVAEKLLEQTDWRVGYVSSELSNVSTTFYFLNVKDSLTKLQQVTGCEIIFRVEISDNEITDKWIEIHEQLGNRKAHRFEYGTSALEIVRQSSTSDLFTALIGRGKGEESGDGYGRKITFEDIEASDKPLGQDYIENELATAIYGIRTMSGMVRRTGIVEYNTEDKQELLELTRRDLEYLSRPKTEFKTTVEKIGDVNIGDEATLHKYEIGLHYLTRIRKVVRDRKNDINTEVILGDYVLDSSTKKQANINSTIKNLVDVQEEQEERIGNIIVSADGGNTITYGELEPDKKRVGDMWYKKDPSDPTKDILLVWNGNAWEKTTDTEKLKNDIEKAQADITEVQEVAEGTALEISNAIEGSGFVNLGNLIASKISGEEADTLFFQNVKDIGLVYEENGVMKAMIGIIDGKIFQQGQQILLKGDEIIADGTLTVTEEMFADGITFNWAKGETLDVNDINLINLNMKNISGGSIELSEGFKITNNGQDVLSVDAQTGKVKLEIPNLPTKEDIDDAVNEIEIGARNLVPVNSMYWEVGNIDGSGNYVAHENTLRIVEDFWMEIQPNTDYIYQDYDGNLQIKIVEYDENKTFLQSSDWITGSNYNFRTHNQAGLMKVALRFRDTTEHRVEYLETARFKIERGTKPTDWTPATEDVQALLNSKANSESMEAVEQELIDLGNSKADSNVVSDLEMEIQRYRERIIENELSVEEAEKEIVNMLSREEGMQTVLGDLSASMEFVDTHITFADEGILIATTDRQSGVRISPERIDFINGGSIIAHIENGELQFDSGVFLEDLRIGEHRFKKEPNGQTVIAWIK